MRYILLFLIIGSYSYSYAYVNPKVDSLHLFSETNIILHKKSALKNTLYFQILGDTPTAGIGYKRNIFNNDTFSLETGIGVGFMPNLFNKRINPKPSNFSFSHNVNFILNSEKRVKPILGYSGMFFSGIFYKNKLYSYIPSPNLGIRYSKHEYINFNLIWFGYLYKRDIKNLINETELQTLRETRIFIIPSLSIQYNF